MVWKAQSRSNKNPYWKLVSQTNNSGIGYNIIQIDNKPIKRHRIIAFAYLNLDINNLSLEIDHINGDRLNNNVDNLRIVNHQENMWNRKETKGYHYHKASNKFKAQINLNDKNIHLGLFTTEEDARQAYLNAKTIYHIIPDRK